MRSSDKSKVQPGGWSHQRVESVDSRETRFEEKDMENRIAKLEVATEYIQRDAAALREGFGGVAESIAQSRERLVTIETRLEHMPTKLEMWLGVGAILLTAGGGLWWLVQQYLGPMLANAAGG